MSLSKRRICCSPERASQSKFEQHIVLILPSIEYFRLRAACCKRVKLHREPGQLHLPEHRQRRPDRAGCRGVNVGRGVCHVQVSASAQHARSAVHRGPVGRGADADDLGLDVHQLRHGEHGRHSRGHAGVAQHVQDGLRVMLRLRESQLRAARRAWVSSER